jgi:hypothetical protein
MDNYRFSYPNGLSAHLLHTKGKCALNTLCYIAISHKQNDILLQFLQHIKAHLTLRLQHRTPHFARACTHTHTHTHTHIYLCNLENTGSTFSLRGQEGQQQSSLNLSFQSTRHSLFHSANFIGPTPQNKSHIVQLELHGDHAVVPPRPIH